MDTACNTDNLTQSNTNSSQPSQCNTFYHYNCLFIKSSRCLLQTSGSSKGAR